MRLYAEIRLLGTILNIGVGSKGRFDGTALSCNTLLTTLGVIPNQFDDGVNLCRLDHCRLGCCEEYTKSSSRLGLRRRDVTMPRHTARSSAHR
jgi:hypothetical protein